MTTESKKVCCEYCYGTGVSSARFRSEAEEVKAAPTACSECDGTGKMEIRKTAEESEWSSRCPTCEGKGFKDSWDYQTEKHDTPACTDCDGTGGIPYLKPVA